MLAAKTNPYELTDAQVKKLHVDVERLAGPEEAGRRHWAARTSIGADGAWRVAVEFPLVSDEQLGSFVDAPWEAPNLPAVLASRTAYLALADAIPLLGGADNPERKLARRREAIAAERERQVAARDKELQEAKERREAAAKHKAARPARWRALPREVRAKFLVAANYPRTPSVALLEEATLLMGGRLDTASPPDTFEPELADG
jgi:hypothetical protein